MNITPRPPIRPQPRQNVFLETAHRTLPRPARNGKTRAGVVFVLRHSRVRLLIQREEGCRGKVPRHLPFTRNPGARERGAGGSPASLGPANEGGRGRALETIGGALSFLSGLLLYYYYYFSPILLHVFSSAATIFLFFFFSASCLLPLFFLLFCHSTGADDS